MKILVYECKKGTSIEETELETLLNEYQIVIIEDKSRSSKKPMSNVIIRDENTAFAFNYLCKGIAEYYIYYISASVHKQNGNWVFQMPMSTIEITKIFENIIEHRYKQ